MRLLFIALLFVGCASTQERDFMRSADIDNQTYRYMKSVCQNDWGNRCNCVTAANVNQTVHEALGYQVTPLKMIHPEKKTAHRALDIYKDGKFIRRAMNLPGYIPLNEYIKPKLEQIHNLEKVKP